MILFKNFLGDCELTHLVPRASDLRSLNHINVIWIVSIFIWKPWFNSNSCLCSFESIQSSSEKCFNPFRVLDICVNFHSFQILIFTIFELIHAQSDSIHVCYFEEKLVLFTHTYIYHHTLFFLIYKINFQKYSKVSNLSLSTTSSD